ncbi:putative glycoside hydrolase family 75 protein [Diaporthe ampelina]|uniref:Putative glycoside hydrolase family 75 protein n=1 Tax=Diaporthe ampelina TaxID=1214573 RepID=A0A0G2FRC6_9PEZI|nr:putative glycoside hydrolase family 75 protein [Diaporthe ampelina]
MVALKAAAAFTLLFALQGALAVGPADSSKVRSAKHEQRQAAQKPPVLQAQPSQIPDPTLAAGNGNGQNQQFITGQCTDSTDCGAQQSDLTKVCCASVVDQATGQTVGTCSGAAVGDAAPKLGCGFGDGKANSGAGTAQAQPGGAAAAGGASNNAASGAASGGDAAAAAASGGSCPPTTTNDSLGPDNVGVAGKQFVTGQCTSDANCASNCCVLGGGSDKSIAVCRNEPALKPDEKCGFTCTA